jgi:hypothetical protein
MRREEPMKIFASLLATIVTSLSSVTTIYALSVEEIIKLKHAGVSDSTIELLIKRGGDARSAGVWKQDGWIVYSTESRFPDTPRFENHQSDYPITVYPQIYGGRHHRMK